MKTKAQLYWALGPEGRSAMLAEWLRTHTIKGASVDKALLESCILEASGDDQEMATFLRERYGKNEALAAKFVGGFTRTQDYTQKTQALAAERQKFQSTEQQMTALRQQLEAAEAEKNKIMKDLAAGDITVAKARKMFEILHTKFELTDDDLPGISEMIATAKTGKVVDRTEDLETRLAAMLDDRMKQLEKKFVDSLGPELGSMASLPIIWQDISRQHQELTGKPLTISEQQDILKSAREGNRSLVSVWEEKFNIAGDDGLRMKARDERLRTQWEDDRKKKDAEDLQKRALETVNGRPKGPEMDGVGISPAFKTNFRTYETDPQKPAVATGQSDGVPSLTVLPGQHVRQTGARGPSGGQRAAAKFLEQRTGGGTKVAAA